MKRIRRILFNVLTAMSLLLAIAVSASWATGRTTTLGTWPGEPISRPRIVVALWGARGFALLWFTPETKPARPAIERRFAGFTYLQNMAAGPRRGGGMAGRGIVAEFRGVIVAPLNTLIGAAALASYWLIRRLRDCWQVLPTACPACGYDMRANPARCSECGHEPRPG